MGGTAAGHRFSVTADDHRLGVGLAVYIAGWLAAGAVVAVVLIFVFRGEGHSPSLPPVQANDLEAAARRAGCRIERRRAVAAASLAVRTGIYGHALRPEQVRATARRGVIVIEYRPELGSASSERLEQLQRTVPNGTVLAPARPGAARRLVVTAARRRLLCDRLGADAVDALRLFRGRYVGTPL